MTAILVLFFSYFQVSVVQYQSPVQERHEVIFCLKSMRLIRRYFYSSTDPSFTSLATQDSPQAKVRSSLLRHHDNPRFPSLWVLPPSLGLQAILMTLKFSVFLSSSGDKFRILLVVKKIVKFFDTCNEIIFYHF